MADNNGVNIKTEAIVCDCGHTLVGHPDKKRCVMGEIIDGKHVPCPCKAFRPVMAKAAGKESDEVEMISVSMAGWMLGRLFDNEGKGFIGRKIDDDFQFVAHREKLLNRASSNFADFEGAVIDGRIGDAKKHAADVANYMAIQVRFLEAHDGMVSKLRS